MSQQEADPLTLTAFGTSGDRETVELDLGDFIPTGVDVETLDPALLVLPTSAHLQASALVSIVSFAFESPSAMPLFGHLDHETLVLYGPDALRTVYNGGDLAHLISTPRAQTVFASVTEAYGNLGMPGGGS